MIDIRIDAEGTQRVTQRLAKAPRVVHAASVEGMRRVGLGLQRHLNGSILSGQLLKVRTGNLRRATFYRVEEARDTVSAVLGIDHRKAPYGRIHEKGGTIRPKRARHLTIPLPAALTGAGVARFTASQVIANPGSFGYTGTFTRNKVIFGTRGEGVVEPLFALKTQVTIKAVGYLAHTVDDKRSWILAELQAAVDRGVRELNG